MSDNELLKTSVAYTASVISRMTNNGVVFKRNYFINKKMIQKAVRYGRIKRTADSPCFKRGYITTHITSSDLDIKLNRNLRQR